MRTIRMFLLLLVILLTLTACDLTGSGGTPEVVSSTATPEARWRLRIVNAGEHDLKGLVVMFPDARIVFGDVPAGATTEYRAAPSGVYNYAAYEYIENGETVGQPVIDWMGESPRPGADFTYTLVYNPEQPNALSIELVKASVDR